ncbi:uncharacterized protein LOC118407132 [Branchiostoma floridae]|uniref:Uncharacterized protein LOC118407132 n=1 Tax=Branchiostoma floridae TaxID=7739 RepID=A0A9J7HPP9_BRAFL|nr:uncharacterized protein LOC118407132 [Branchiostoma floridae]
MRWIHDVKQRTPLHLAVGNGHHETVSSLLTACAEVNTRDSEQRTPLHLAAENDHPETVSALLTAGAEVNVLDSQQMTPLHLAAERGHHETVSALLTAGADVNVLDSQQMTPLHLAAGKGHHIFVSRRDRLPRTPLHLAVGKGHPETVSALLTAGADVNVQDNRGFTPIQYATKTGHSKCVEVLLQHKADKDGQKKVLDTILSRLEETDVRLLMRVWSARTGKQEIPGPKVPADLIRDMMKSEYITTGDLRMLGKDMLAAGISFPAIVQDIPGVPDELKHTRTMEAEVGPEGGELEIPGLVRLVVPPGILQQDTVITISTVDVAAILRDPESVNWISGYPWSLGEDACLRELLDQVLFSPAVDVNLHGAQLNGPVKVQTWRPPGSEGMGCLLLKHHDGEGWTDITASTVHQIYSDKISTFLQTFSPLTILWTPLDTLITVGKMVVAALSSRTLNCRFTGYIKPHTGGVEFHVICRDRSIKADDYKPDFTLCGSNKAMFDLYHGNRVDVTVSILQGQKRSRQMKLRAQQCCEDEGQSVQMVLDRPNGKPVKGDVTIRNIQERPPETVCEFSFWECLEGDILTTNTACVHQGAGNTHKMQTHPKRLQAQAAPTDIRTDSSATAVAWCIPIVVELKPPWRELGTNLGLSDADIERIRQRHQDDTGRCCLAVLEEWLHLSGTKATVEGLKTALYLAGQTEIVEREQSMRGKLLELQSEVTDIVHPNFPNLNFVPDKNKEADERRIELNRRTLHDEQKPLYDTSVMFHGSSGSPGFDTYGNVVLMHTRGFPDASSKSLIERGVV